MGRCHRHGGRAVITSVVVIEMTDDSCPLEVALGRVLGGEHDGGLILGIRSRVPHKVVDDSILLNDSMLAGLAYEFVAAMLDVDLANEPPEGWRLIASIVDSNGNPVSPR